VSSDRAQSKIHPTNAGHATHLCRIRCYPCEPVHGEFVIAASLATTHFGREVHNDVPIETDGAEDFAFEEFVLKILNAAIFRRISIVLHEYRRIRKV
jgi:hypothetical protein